MVVEGYRTVYERISHNLERIEAPETWDEIFCQVGVLMLAGEASELDMKSQLTSLALQHAEPSLSDTDDCDFSLLNFEKIKIQLRALGYLQRGSAKRAVSDTNNYWKLTPYGESQLMRLSAIRREQTASPK